MKKILISPLVTEKATTLSQKGVYAFLVHPAATKHQVAEMAEQLYKVTVGSVRMQVRKGKVQRVGRRMTPKKLPNTKIAYVRITKGTIDLFPKA